MVQIEVMKIYRIVNSVFNSNTYVIRHDKSENCWLIDIGDFEPVLDVVRNHNIQGVFLTHTHYDHIYGINKLVHTFPKCVVYTSEYGRQGLFSDKFNQSRYHSDSLIFQGTNLSILKEGDVIDLFQDISLKVIETPGHDPSCLSYYTDNEIFTGDSYIPGIDVITSFPRGNKMDARRSVEKILDLNNFRNIYPGHGEVSCN